MRHLQSDFFFSVSSSAFKASSFFSFVSGAPARKEFF